jgi:dihydrofolate synthase/folylpolyglutamate synthase
MSYPAAIDHLNALGLELAPGSGPRRKFELDHMRTLARALGDPQRQFPAVLIAGTNGKGSTAATLASILSAAGYRTGLYTSPHLARVTERIRVAEPHALLGEITEEDFARQYFRVDEAARKLVLTGALPHHPSFFETLTALAFLHFAERGVDIAILEVGLGGRLDATNIVEPLLSVITDIALDHQDYLGDTLTAIAREKAGILRPNGILITLPQHPEANQAIGEAAVALEVQGINAAAYLPNRSAEPPHPTSETGRESGPGTQAQREAGAPVPARWISPFPANSYEIAIDNQTVKIDSPLPGEHQRRNIALAIASAITLRNQNSYNSDAAKQNSNQRSYNIPDNAIQLGISQTTWPGRLEFLPPNLVLDVAHNPAGAWTLRAAIATLPEQQPRTLIFSCLRDKDLREMAQILFPLFDSTGGRPHDHIILAPIDNPRAATLAELEATARQLDVPVHATRTPAEALALARTVTPTDGLILATGSVYLVGALRELATDTPQHPTSQTK